MNISSNSLYGASSAYSSYGNSSSTNQSSMSTKFAEALLTSMDSDSSGSVDSAEFSSAALALSGSSDTSSATEAFSALDTDQDGVVSIDELSSSLESIMKQQGPMGAGGPPPPPPPQSSSSDDTSSEETSILSALDTNQDGTVSIDELISSIVSSQEDTKEKSIGSIKSGEDDLLKKLMEQVLAQYSTQNSVSTSAFNLSA